MKDLVILEPYEYRMAATVGLHRHLSALEKKLPPRFDEDYPGELWPCHIEGACAECAVSKFLGVFWPGHVDVFAVPDLIIGGTKFDVRWSRVGKLKVKGPDKDALDTVIVGVSGKCPIFTIEGALVAEHVQTHCPQWYVTATATRPYCWLVPHDKLKPLRTFVRVPPELEIANGVLLPR